MIYTWTLQSLFSWFQRFHSITFLFLSAETNSCPLGCQAHVTTSLLCVCVCARVCVHVCVCVHRKLRQFISLRPHARKIIFHTIAGRAHIYTSWTQISDSSMKHEPYSRPSSSLVFDCLVEKAQEQGYEHAPPSTDRY